MNKSKQKPSILIVEDNFEICKLVEDFLLDNGYCVTSLYDGQRVIDTIKTHTFSLILLDLMLPYQSGDMLLAQIRKFSLVPVIVISAKETTQNKIDLLRLGADDYITKPFDMGELLARIESRIRRAYTENQPDRKMEYEGLVIDLELNTAYLQGIELVLTAKEYVILELLMKYPDKVFSKANLFESVWKEEYFREDNTLNVHISNLRSKLKAVCPHKNYIDTVWGIGYRLHRAKG